MAHHNREPLGAGPPPTSCRFPPFSCAGSLDLALVSTSGAHGASNLFAQCFSQVSISLGSDCKVTVLPTANEGVYVSNLWAPNGLLPYNSYASWCATRV